MTNFLLLLLIASCSSFKKPTLGQVFATEAQFRVRTIEVKDDKKGFEYVAQTGPYLTILFEQSRDPYYGTPKWSEKCLRENVIGTEVRKDNHSYHHSELYLSVIGEPGYCEGMRYHDVRIYCAGSREVKIYQFLRTDHLNLEAFELCP